MADKKIVQSGGVEVSDKDAAGCLSQGHSKAAAVPTAWGQKDQSLAGQKIAGR